MNPAERFEQLLRAILTEPSPEKITKLANSTFSEMKLAGWNAALLRLEDTLTDMVQHAVVKHGVDSQTLGVPILNVIGFVRQMREAGPDVKVKAGP